MTVIETENLTKDYGGGRGVFDLNLSVRAGEMFGFAGTNGAGKTTTIRLIMGFIRPTSAPRASRGLTLGTTPARSSGISAMCRAKSPSPI